MRSLVRLLHARGGRALSGTHDAVQIILKAASSVPIAWHTPQKKTTLIASISSRSYDTDTVLACRRFEIRRFLPKRVDDHLETKGQEVASQKGEGGQRERKLKSRILVLFSSFQILGVAQKLKT